MNEKPQDRASILIVDDDPDVLADLDTILTNANYKCHGARDSDAALKAARLETPDLILCDINLDGENGLQLCQELRQQPGLADVPVMFLSGAQIPDVIRRSHAAGGTYYLRKPFDPSVLLELVDKALWIPHLVKARLEV